MENQNKFKGDEVFFRIDVETEEDGKIILEGDFSGGIEMDKRIANRIIEKDSKKTTDPTFDTIKDLDDEDLTFVEILQEN